MLCCFVAATPVAAQVSPGPLSRAHKSLSGPTQCTSCHQIGLGKASLKCLECHVAIRQRVEAGRGLHATYVAKDAGSQACAKCHSEHNGESFRIVQWEPLPGRFDHSKTGYVLEGKHAALDCRKCHAPAHISEAERSVIGPLALPQTYLGLSRECLTCHADEHRGQLSKDCSRCHDFAGWKPALQFNHAKTLFPLTGAHGQVACQKCHFARGPDQAVPYTGLSFDKCSSCHADVHKGAFSSGCQTCHNTTSWKQLSVSAKFDHSRTAFPLLGKHGGVACLSCHHGADFKKPLAHAKCTDCHTPDPHNGQFARRADRGECSACHTVDAFKPARFDVKDHALTAYPLEGKHARVECAKCHLPARKATLYKVKYSLCTDCHKDVHERQFAGAPYENRCERCHTVQTYRPSLFTLARHQQSRFPLTGGHLAIACMECHRAQAPTKNALPVPYHFENVACDVCHTDPHNGQFAERMAHATAGGKAAGCEACHSIKIWRDLARFDHASTRFALTGAHRAVACVDCHRPPNMATSLRSVSFRSAPSTCEECHADIHGGQFAAALGKPVACADCHITAKWKPSLFDHDKRTTFALRGGHQDVRCGECHNLFREVKGRSVLFYKPTPRECAACHKPDA
jgi:hypothetical protein